MALKFNCILAVTLLAVVVASLFFHASAALGGGGLPGGWSPISDTKDPQVVEIGKFAVNEYNKQAKTNLVFKRVKKGATQVVAGTNYRLVISANDGGRSNNRYKCWLVLILGFLLGVSSCFSREISTDAYPR
ncbi:cysteine proteinase inhibitor 5 [Nicotiana tabacum]|uniref:Cysteine proteinase inhibitor 5 n=1 Tax=Nicotiana tabacum TaxID=4097 RepID=A0AC58S6P1_TOBAC